MDIDTLRGLTQCPLFAGLNDEEVIELMHTVRYRILRYRKGDIFALAGETCQHADIVISGEMMTNLIGPSGRSIRLTMMHSGKMLAPAFLFAQTNLYPVNVEAAVDTQVLRLTQYDLEKLLHTDTRLMVNFIRILSNNIAYLTKKIGMLSMTVREKIMLYLKEQRQEQQTNRIHLSLSRQQLADLFGIQKFSLQRCLNELQEEGVIRLEGKFIQMLN